MIKFNSVAEAYVYIKAVSRALALIVLIAALTQLKSYESNSVVAYCALQPQVKNQFLKTNIKCYASAIAQAFKTR